VQIPLALFLVGSSEYGRVTAFEDLYFIGNEAGRKGDITV